ncbi:tetratricopeptide repeat protein, partial [Leucothrix pacifica]
MNVNLFELIKHPVMILILTLLGAIGDITTIEGKPVVLYLFLASAFAFFFIFFVAKQKKGKLLRFSIIGMVVFILIFSLQKIFAQSENGLLAEKFPAASKIQLKLYKTLYSTYENTEIIIDGNREIKSTLDSNQEKLNVLISNNPISVSVVSPYSKKKITGEVDTELQNKCYSFVDYGNSELLFLNHKAAAENLSRYLEKNEANLSFEESGEKNCILGLRLLGVNMNEAIKHFKTALSLNPNNIGAMLGMAKSQLPEEAYKNYIIRAYEIVEEKNNVSALPFIIEADMQLKQHSDDYAARDELIESAIQISDSLRLGVNSERLKEFRLSSKINTMNDEQLSGLLKKQFSKCNIQSFYIREIACFVTRARIFNQLKQYDDVSIELKRAIDVAIQQHDIPTEILLINLLVTEGNPPFSWREREKILLCLLPRAEKFAHWSLLLETYSNLAHIASFSELWSRV